MKTIAVLFNNFGPYHLARVAAAAKHASAKGALQVVGIELTRQSSVYKWKADISKLPFTLHTVTPQDDPAPPPAASTVRAMLAALEQIKPNALAISGYASPTMLAALRWCRKNNCTAILMSETNEDDFTRNWFKEWLKKRIVRRFNSALVGGATHKRYLQKLGMDSSCIFTGYDVVDNDTFSPAAIHHLPSPIPARYFLAINRFVPKKNLDLMIRAYASYRQKTPAPWDLIICGDGELRPSLEKQILKAGIDTHVHLPGFLQEEALLPYFANASCFVHASTREQWGLVVNEAMAAGLPVILSNRCGCFEDLLQEGVNGFGFNPLDEKQLAAIMDRTSSGDVDLGAMGKAALRHIGKYSLNTFADGLLRASAFS